MAGSPSRHCKGWTVDGENHHIAKTVLIGQINKDNQFDVVYKLDAPIEPDPFLKTYTWFDPQPWLMPRF